MSIVRAHGFEKLGVGLAAWLPAFTLSRSSSVPRRSFRTSLPFMPRSRADLGRSDDERARAASAQATQHARRPTITDPVREGVTTLAMEFASPMQRRAQKLDRGMHAEAIPELAMAARYLTRNASLHLRLGICHYTTGQFGLARSYLRRTIELLDSMAQAHQIMGRRAAAEGRFESAAGWYRQAIEREPDNPEHLVLLGEALESLGRPGEAIDAYRRALRLDSAHAEAQARLEALGAG